MPKKSLEEVSKALKKNEKNRENQTFDPQDNFKPLRVSVTVQSPVYEEEDVVEAMEPSVTTLLKNRNTGKYVPRQDLQGGGAQQEEYDKQRFDLLKDLLTKALGKSKEKAKGYFSRDKSLN